ncbi:hypothetical protein ACMFMF_011075 [Clarireedia jacksonii]
MLSKISLVAFVLASAVVAIPVLEDGGSTCSAPEGDGICKATSSCVSNGFNVAGHCPGSASIQCCIAKTCQPPNTAGGLCLNTSDGCSGGSFHSGYCPGNSGIQCCVKKSDNDAQDDQNHGKPSGKDVVDAAVKKEGITYVFGGGGCDGPSNGGFDCSGLTQYAICQAEHYTIPRTAQQQYHSSLGKKIPRAQAKAGDFIFWGTDGDCANRVHHVGIFIRDNWMVNAPHTGAKVRESAIGTSSELCDYAIRFWKD